MKRYLFLLIVLIYGQFVFSQTQKELEKERQQIEQQIKQINSNLDETQSHRISAIEKVQTLNQRIAVAERLVRINNREANMLSREINANTQAIDKLRTQLKQLKAEYAQMVVDAYKSKSQQNRIMFLLSSDNFLQAYKRLQYMKQFAAYRKKQGKEIEIQTRQLQALNEKLFEQRQAKEQLLAQNRQTIEKLNKDKVAEKELIASIRKKESQYKKELERKQEKITEIDQLIQKLIREAIARENKKLGKTSNSRFKMTPEAKLLGGKFEDNKGKLPWPVVSGFVSRPYGTRHHAVVKTVMTKSEGVRIDTQQGAKARAIFDGEVSQIMVIPNAFKVVMIRHGQYISVYKNIDKLNVRKGDKVKRNQFIGTIGQDLTDGSTTLGFYIYKNSKTQNPADWIYKM
ncbi:murein hydrolase activator EnvC [Flavobacterium sp. CS20]|uniref:murein hydrolase activator EnvC family protein n=1 Tax=Flavobacterium sp. CS20 TaxID=2775246 RepID=UPI001B3A1397|nr:peptidoglycan DD-metalloendopeptidase family protein [Flavobacterium sp. CS20]QTY26861.1 peptidoglycan DD-metalloendopeptidase family protein [Flavobacterium sp. CS20]